MKDTWMQYVISPPHKGLEIWKALGIYMIMNEADSIFQTLFFFLYVHLLDLRVCHLNL